MNTIKQILDLKGYDVCSIDAEESVFTAISIMAEKDIGALIVLHDGEVKGIITERDYARKVTLKGRSSVDTKTADVMTSMVIYAEPASTVEECMALMTEKHVRHLPIMDNKKLIGVISIGDLVKAEIAQQKFLIDQLVHYIHS